MNENIFSKIESSYHNLSKTHKKLADYIRENISSIAFLSIMELGDKSGVSLASITRFTRELGYAGYSDFQKSVAQIVRENMMPPMREIKTSIMDDNASFLEKIFYDNANILTNTYSENLKENFDNALQSFIGSRKIYITASRSSYSVAYYLYFMLKGFLENVELITNENSDISNKLTYVRKEDCLIVISYSRYTKISFNIAEYFHNLGCNVTSITDSLVAPIALKSNNVLVAKNTDGAYSFVGAMTLANAIVTALGKHDKLSTMKNMENQDRLAMENDIYL